METRNELCRVLAEKKEAFLRYEKETAALLTCAIDEIQLHMENRQRLADEIDHLDARLSQLAADNPNHQDEIRMALKNRCARNRLSAEMQPVFDAAQGIFTVIHRIQRMESSVEERIQQEQKILLEKIKELNRTAGIAQTSHFSSLQSTKA